MKKNNNNNYVYLSVNVFTTKVLIGDTTVFYMVIRASRLQCKRRPSFLSYFKTLNIAPAL